MSLHSTGECISHQLLNVVSWKRCDHSLLECMPFPRTRLILVFEVHLVVQKRHDQAGRRSRRPTLFALIATDGVIAVQRALAFVIQTPQNRMHVVGEESLVIKDGRESLGTGFDGHGFAMLVAIHLDYVVETFLESLPIGSESDNGEYDTCTGTRLIVTADLEDFRCVPRVDVVAGRRTSVACENGKVGAGDSKR